MTVEERRAHRNAYMRDYNKANRAKATATVMRWKRAHPEKVAAYHVKYAAKNKAKLFAYVSKWRKANPDKIASYQRVWRSNNPHKRRAHFALYNAVNGNKIVRPDRCSKCGKAGNVDGHHPDYSQKLLVVWLCPQCHKNLHK